MKNQRDRNTATAATTGRSLPVKSQFMLEYWQYELTRKGWSVKELAAKANLSYNYVRKITNGTMIPARYALRSLCRVIRADFYSTWVAMKNSRSFDPKAPRKISPAQLTAQAAIMAAQSVKNPLYGATMKALLHKLDILNRVAKMPPPSIGEVLSVLFKQEAILKQAGSKKRPLTVPGAVMGR